MSQHDTSMQEAYRPRDLKLQYHYVHGCGFLEYQKSI